MRVFSLVVTGCLAWHTARLAAAEGGLTEEACEAKAARLESEAEGNAAQLQAAEKLFRSLEEELQLLRAENGRLLSTTVTKVDALDQNVDGPVAKMAYDISTAILTKILAKTEIDDHVVNYTADVMDQIASIDYKEYVQNLKQHELYQTHVAPSVSPVLEATKVYTVPALEAAQVLIAGVTVESVKSRFVEALQFIDTVLVSPVFSTFQTVVPTHARLVPSSLADRILIFLILAFVGYESLCIMRFFLRITWKVSRLVILLNLKVFSWWFWIATGFHCCGLCRRSSAKKLAATAKTQEGKATVEELTKLLESSKKKGKLEAAVQHLLTFTTDGKVLSGKGLPQAMHGKQLDKEVLKKSAENFKELKLATFGL